MTSDDLEQAVEDLRMKLLKTKSVYTVAELAGVTPSSAWALKIGKSKHPTVTTIIKLLRAFERMEAGRD